MRKCKTLLPNGLTLVSLQMPHLQSALASLYVRVGSRHETPQTNGISHLLEHLFFRGSRRSPNTRKINLAIEWVGGSLNAVTMRDFSYYYTACHPTGLATTLRILGNMLSPPKLHKLAVEKRIVLEEMLDEVDDKGEDIDLDNLSKMQLFNKHPLAFKIAGTPQSLAHISRKQLLSHYQRHYVASNMVLGVASPLPPHKVARAAAKAFSYLPKGERVWEAPPTPPLSTGPQLLYIPRDESQLLFRLSFLTVPENHPHHLHLHLLQRILDDGLSSWLPFEVVEKRGLAYSVETLLEGFSDVGIFNIDSASTPTRAPQVVDCILKTVSKLTHSNLAVEELRRAKRRKQMQLEFAKDCPGELLSRLAATELFFCPESFEARFERIRKIKTRELVALARQLFCKENLRVVAVGPQKARAAFAKAIHHNPLPYREV
ncbi:MAG: insulinase family protein [Proteobacteria bacterium]|nr:insulinase family protein [Cystobacterineae bacterium]MCL2258784.1 insulinase family protein [Cystobacterineae bacterium]MCL2314688.1 insulinase family protein [Pseudomonadota bacterium]